MYVGITDYDWFTTLKDENCDEVNFWKPSGRTNFKALNIGDLLHSPRDYIVVGGFFLKFSILPSSLAWDAFGVLPMEQEVCCNCKNGSTNIEKLINLRILIHRSAISFFPHLFILNKRIGFPFRQIGARILSKGRPMILVNF